MIVIGAAGAIKLSDVARFEHALQKWSIVPGASARSLSLVIPLIEVGIASAWIVCWRRRGVLVSAVLLLMAFTAAMALEWMLATPPNCAYLGLRWEYFDRMDDARIGILRNVALIGMLAAAIRGAGRGSAARRDERAPRASAERHAEAARGFTLTELLVVLAVVALLSAFALHGLRQSRVSARASVALSDLRQHAANMLSYTGDYAGMFPWFTDPFRTIPVCNPAMNECVNMGYWDAVHRWNMPLAAAYYGGNHLHPSFYPPGFVEEEWNGFTPNITRYLYSSAFITDWRFWDPSQRVLDGSQLRATALNEVRWPSAKTLLVCSYPYGDTSTVGLWSAAKNAYPMSLTDGHAEQVAPDRLEMPYRGSSNVEGASWLGYPGMSTLMGVRGRDVR